MGTLREMADQNTLGYKKCLLLYQKQATSSSMFQILANIIPPFNAKLFRCSVCLTLDWGWWQCNSTREMEAWLGFSCTSRGRLRRSAYPRCSRFARPVHIPQSLINLMEVYIKTVNVLLPFVALIGHNCCKMTDATQMTTISTGWTSLNEPNVGIRRRDGSLKPTDLEATSKHPLPTP